MGDQSNMQNTMKGPSKRDDWSSSIRDEMKDAAKQGVTHRFVRGTSSLSLRDRMDSDQIQESLIGRGGRTKTDALTRNVSLLDIDVSSSDAEHAMPWDPSLKTERTAAGDAGMGQETPESMG